MAKKFNPEKRVKYLLAKAMRATKVDAKQEYLLAQSKKMSKKQTKPEREFEKLCKKLKLNFEKQKIVGGKIFDFYLNDINMLIEVHGNYWHGKDLEMENMNEIQRKSTKNDWNKEVIAIGLGYKFEIFWESDLLKNNELCNKRLKTFFD